MNIDKATELEFSLTSQRNRLKQCREIMRNKGIGQLYPIAAEDFRGELRKFARSEDKRSGKTFEQLKSDERLQIDLLLEFIEKEGLLPEELERFLRKRNG